MRSSTPTSDPSAVDAAAGADGAPSASVVVITHNRRHLLEAHLPPLLRDPATAEVVVVDDASTDGTAELLDQLTARHPQLVRVSIPHSGMDAARRRGVEAASGELVVLMDDDVEPSEGLVSRHVARHTGRRGLVVVGYMPIPLGPDRTPGDLAVRAYAHDYEQVMARYEADPSRILFDLWNGHVSMRREDYLRARADDDGWPIEAFFEDRHLGLQCLRLGLTGHFDRSIIGYHRHGGDLASFRRNARKMGYGGRVLHERHADLLGDFDPDASLEGLSAPLRRLVRLGDTDRALLVASWFEAIASLAGTVRWWWLEERAARVMRRLELRIGARLAELELADR